MVEKQILNKERHTQRVYLNNFTSFFLSNPVSFACFVAMKTTSQKSFVPRDFFPKDMKTRRSLIKNKFGNAVLVII